MKFQQFSVIAQFSIILLLASYIVGCSSSGGSSNPRQSSLDEHKALWAQASIMDYQYTYSKICFCAEVEDIVVIVQSGTISEAFYTPSGTYLDAAELESLYTVEGLFDIIQQAIDSETARLEVTYNGTYGYPESIFIDSDDSFNDNEITHNVSNFQ